ncbi:hypothetical protein HPB47_006117 [Ixodes persulcatus]|uniref:Uncharacterized protein n=1 Tax=Ixodes persulcatus TaxID=34615 RepID=A0AC60PB66_IXOPE|nr:hypothetical protein HPB47_006117 [Ixodes persulcatus]
MFRKHTRVQKGLRLASQNGAFRAAVFLDPRYNILLSEGDKRQARAHLSNTWANIVRFSRDANDCRESPTSSLGSDDELDALLKEKEKSQVAENYEKRRSLQSIAAALSDFEREKRLKKDENVLAYWETQRLERPELHELAKVVLVCPATQPDRLDAKRGHAVFRAGRASDAGPECITRWLPAALAREARRMRAIADDGSTTPCSVMFEESDSVVEKLIEGIRPHPSKRRVADNSESLLDGSLSRPRTRARRSKVPAATAIGQDQSRRGSGRMHFPRCPPSGELMGDGSVRGCTFVLRGAIKRVRCSVRLGDCATEAHSWARGGASAPAAAMTSLLRNAQSAEARAAAAAPARLLCSRLGGSEARALAY